MLDLDRIIIDKISILVTKTFIWASRLSYEDSANAVIIIVLLIQLTLTSMRFDEVSSTLVSYFLNFFVQIFLSFKVAKFPVCRTCNLPFCCYEKRASAFTRQKQDHTPPISNCARKKEGAAFPFQPRRLLKLTLFEKSNFCLKILF